MPAWHGPLAMWISSLLFSGMALCVGEAHRADPNLGTGTTSFVRAVVNLALVLLLVQGDWRLLVFDARPALWLRGLAGTGALMCYFAAVARSGLGEAAFLNHTSTFWVALLAPVVLGERTGRGTWAAVVVALGGLVLLLEPGQGDGTGRALGAVSGVLATVAYMAIRSAANDVPAVSTVAWFTGIGTIGAGALALTEPWPAWGPAWGWMVGAGVFATVAQLAMTRAYQLSPAALVSAVAAAGPLFSAVWDWLWLDARPGPRQVAGMVALVLASSVLPFIRSGVPSAAAAPSPSGAAPPGQRAWGDSRRQPPQNPA